MPKDIYDLIQRPRRLRQDANFRDLLREATLTTNDLIYPVFVTAQQNTKRAIETMPGIYQWSLDRIQEEIDQVLDSGIRRLILFGIPAEKDAVGSDAINEEGIIQQTLRKLKADYPELMLITDVCMCEYTDHGHCGVLADQEVDNDQTLNYLQRQAISHAESGVDMVAPSGMMDGMVGAIRDALDDHNFTQVPIMSYAVKYASAYYGPFRDAAESAPQFGNRRAYQMDPANRREALREAELDIDEGADILMVKPALAYLDIISLIKDSTSLPVACYNVSGEYSMIKAAAEKGWINGDAVMLESLLAMKRAGADIIITYFAKEAANFLKV
ncbi:MAG: porphobilinogen synthase [Candidatus Marinimicrobia bacterium]|nr:porphobilinogen synthase [Candidatus Neomarinimicrobiota bacterium]